MNLKSISRWTVLLGLALILVVKFMVRPYIHIPVPWKPVIGLLPNLICAFMLPFAACWLFERYFGMQTMRQLQIACWFGLVGIVINEFFQLMPVFGRTFDYLDILSSFTGVFFGYVVYARLMLKLIYKTYP